MLSVILCVKLINMLKIFLWAFLEKGGQFFIQFLSVVILSRFLSPEEYGIYGIMAIFIAISELLIDSGFGGALVQKKDVKQIDINTLFVSNLFISLVLYLILFFAAPYIAIYYIIPKLSLYIRVLGITIMFYSLTIVHITLLQKELKFKKSANITVISTSLSVLFAVLIAYFGGGIWALIFQPLLMSVFMAGILWSIERRNISIQFSRASFNELWSFGSKLLAANLLNTIYYNFTTSVIPKISSVRNSGFYFQASRLNTIPTSMLQTTIDKAAFPVLSKESCSENVLNKAIKLNLVINSFTYFLFPFLSLFAVEIIYIILGKQWCEAANFLSILAWGGWGFMYQVLSRNIFKSVGDTKTILRVDMLKTLLGLVVLGLSTFFGVMFLIWGITLSMFLGAFIYMYELHHKLKYKILCQLKEIAKPLISSVLTYISLYPMVSRLENEWYNIFIVFPFAFIYVFINILMKNECVILLIKKVKYI